MQYGRTKITQLPTANPPNGTEVLELVKNGSNYKVTINQIRAGAGAGALTQSLFGIVTALSSGAGTLSGIATNNDATPIGQAVQFAISGITNGWWLDTGTDATGPGVQRPDDFNAISNPRVWRQWL